MKLASLSVVLLAILNTEAYCGEDLYSPRFEKLDEKQRQWLRECLAGQKDLTQLYANYRSKGERTVLNQTDPENTRPFEYMQRSDGYILNRLVMASGDGTPFPYGTLIRPEGYVRVSSRGQDGRGKVTGFGTDTEKGLDVISSERFRLAPMLIQVWPVIDWISERQFHPKLDFENPFRAVDLSVNEKDSRLGDVVTLKLFTPNIEPESRTIKVSFLKDHLWAVSRVERISTGPNVTRDGSPNAGRQVTEIEYDLSTPRQPRMKRFRYTDSVTQANSSTEINWSSVPVSSLEDYRFDTLEFVTPDLKEFEPSALGLSNITATPSKPDGWLWKLGLFVGGVVLVILAFIIRRRMSK